MNFFRLILFLSVFSVMMSSCSRQVLFTNNRPLSAEASKNSDDNTKSFDEKVLESDDKIMVSIWDHSELSIGSLQGTYSLAEEFGKWVMIDANGEVKLPQLGSVKLQGLTVREATAHLEKLYSKYIMNPVITLRLLNNQVTVLGEVRNPGIYIFSADKVKITDLIGKAQGLTDYAKARKIKVLRENQEIIIDLTNSASIASKAYTIYPGDVIYIPPTSGKAWEKFSSKLIPIASLITAIALVYSVTNKSD
jgi:polysaccharide biosynthesis/export protein